MMPNEELHDELMLALREYFKANQQWATLRTRRSAINLRHWLNEIRRLCHLQRIVVQDWRYETFSPLRPSKRAKNLIDKKANQNGGGSDDSNAN